MTNNIINIKGIQYDLREISDTELIDLRISLDTNIASIKTQIEDAQTKRIETGEYADSAWFRSAQNARRHMSRSVQLINLQLRKNKQFRNIPFTKCFFDICKERLSSDEFNTIRQIAEKRYKEENKLENRR